jgi:DNA-binding response OmpR family regulator
LLAEDDADTCEALARLMAHDGHVVVCAQKIEEARRACRVGRFDVLVCVIDLPDRALCVSSLSRGVSLN